MPKDDAVTRKSLVFASAYWTQQFLINIIMSNNQASEIKEGYNLCIVLGDMRPCNIQNLYSTRTCSSPSLERYHQATVYYNHF